jgi:hypothetical protein
VGLPAQALGRRKVQGTDMSTSRSQPSAGPGAPHLDVIEASFERAAAYTRLGDYARALQWLDRAAALNGGLPPAYRAQRDRLARAAAVRPGPARRV